MEFTFVNKNIVSVDTEVGVALSRELDQPNDPNRKDYVLGEMKGL